jgi:nitrogen fixation protein FixH
MARQSAEKATHREVARKEITGRQVFVVTAGAFGVVIAVNLVLAWSAISTFPGLEVKNSYVASQHFEVERLAQERLGWRVAVDYAPGDLRVAITEGAADLPAEVTALQVRIGRATVAHDDVEPAMERDMGVFHAPVNLAPGRWLVRIEAEAADGTRFRQRHDIFVRG